VLLRHPLQHPHHVHCVTRGWREKTTPGWQGNPPALDRLRHAAFFEHSVVSKTNPYNQGVNK
jgi:hypothetical protein